MNRFSQRVAQRLRALSPHRRLGALAFLVVLVGAAACGENLESGRTCTTLCPLANETLRDTVFDPVAFDTSLSGFPLAGTTRPLLLATSPSPDSLDVRAVVSFDSLPSKYVPPAGGDSLTIATVDDTFIRLYLDTTLVPRVSGTATLQAYDVDTPSGTDTATATLAGLFTPARLLGSTTLTLTANKSAGDSLHLHLSDGAFALKARAGARLRVGLRLTSSVRAQLRVAGVLSGAGLSATAPQLSFDAATDTVYKAVVVNPSTVLSTGTTSVSSAVDQSLVVVSPRGATNGDLIVGGTPGRRSLIRFNLPARLADSTDIVRATLELTQRPAPGVSAGDTVRLRSEAVLATTKVTDLTQATLLTAQAGLSADTLKLSPADSGMRQLSLVTLIRAYRSLPAATTRAISIRSLFEGAEAGEVRFFSAEAPAAVRPRLRLTYIPRTSFGVP